MNPASLIFAFFCILSLPLRAESPLSTYGYGNSALASMYNQTAKGRFCGQVTEEDLKGAGFPCRISNSDKNFRSMRMSTSHSFEWNVFQVAAESQLAKNNCLNEQVNALMNDKQLLQNWYSVLVAAWMGQKKSELILNKCRTEVFNRLDLANIKRYGMRKAYHLQMKTRNLSGAKPLTKKWEDVCFDSAGISSLNAAKSLFPYALPVISHPDFFKLTEKNRSMLLNKKTGKPLSDEDLLESDLQDLSFIKLTENAEFDKTLSKAFQDLQSERIEMNQKISEGKSTEGFELDSEMKSYLFQDETIYQTLKARNQIGQNYSGLGSTNTSEVSNGAFCMLSKFEPTFIGEMTAFGIESVAAGGLFFKAAKGIKYLSGLEKAEKVKRSMKYGVAAIAYPTLANEILKICPVPKLGYQAYQTQKVLNRTDKELKISVMGKSLPASIGFGISTLDIDPQLTPSCKKIEDKNLVHNSTTNSGCLVNALLSVSPLKVALPAMFLDSH